MLKESIPYRTIRATVAARAALMNGFTAMRDLETEGAMYAEVRYGMTPMQAIQSATIHAADLLERANDLGAVEPGKYADIIAVAGDPLRDIKLERVHFVIKGGEVHKNEMGR